MSSRERSVLGVLRGLVGTAGGYRCGLCGLSFDSDRPNCPACGGPVEDA